MNEMSEFKVGEIYMRSKIHDKYGGERQTGISTPKGHPLIFIFPRMSGKQHGYENGFQPDGSFWHYGRGLRGDMSLTRAANSAVVNHSQNGKSLHLFQDIGGGKVLYEGEFYCEKYHWEKAPDTDGNIRNAIVFELRRA